MKIVSFTQMIERIACNSRWLYCLTKKYYEKTVKREVELAEITADDHVLVVGGGPCPHSGILIHELTGARVTIIDNQQNCVDCSIQLIKKLGLQEHIDIKLEDGINTKTWKYSVVHLALQISPKGEVLKSLDRNARIGTRILVRLPKESLKNLYSYIENNLFSEMPTALHKGIGNTSNTALYTVRGDIFEKQTA